MFACSNTTIRFDALFFQYSSVCLGFHPIESAMAWKMGWKNFFSRQIWIFLPTLPLPSFYDLVFRFRGVKLGRDWCKRRDGRRSASGAVRRTQSYLLIQLYGTARRNIYCKLCPLHHLAWKVTWEKSSYFKNFTWCTHEF